MASITFPNYSESAGKNLTYFLSNSFSSVSTCCSTFDKLQRILREYFLPRFTFKLTSWYYSEHRLLVSTFALEFFHQFSRCNSFTSLFFFFFFFSHFNVWVLIKPFLGGFLESKLTHTISQESGQLPGLQKSVSIHFHSIFIRDLTTSCEHHGIHFFFLMEWFFFVDRFKLDIRKRFLQ